MKRVAHMRSGSSDGVSAFFKRFDLSMADVQTKKMSDHTIYNAEAVVNGNSVYLSLDVATDGSGSVVVEKEGEGGKNEIEFSTLNGGTASKVMQAVSSRRKPIKTIHATAGQSFSFEATSEMKMFASGDRQGVVQEVIVEPGDILTVTHNPRA